MSKPWLLPDGIEEVLPRDSARLEKLRRQLIDLYGAWGYDLVIPPFIEYLESLLTGSGHDLNLQTFKLTDQLSGRLMGVRADMTPQVARIDAHHLRRDLPVRLCYIGTVLLTRPAGFALSRSPLQVGAELYGHGGVEADVEILCLMLETLEASGVGHVHIDLGHVGIFRALSREAGLTGPQERALHEALQLKARGEIDLLLAELAVPAALRERLAGLAELNGGGEVLGDARALLSGANDAAVAALENVEQMAEAVVRHKPDVSLHFDLAELRGYAYHTGMVFAAFVPGHGGEVARGGRYDGIGEVFGRSRPATGFSADLKTLLSMAAAAESDVPAGILSPWPLDDVLMSQVRALRAAGERVIYTLPGQPGTPTELGCDRVLVNHGESWEVQLAGDVSE